MKQFLKATVTLKGTGGEKVLFFSVDHIDMIEKTSWGFALWIGESDFNCSEIEIINLDQIIKSESD